MEALNGTEFDGTPCDISLAKPQMDKLKKEKQRLERERRQLQLMAVNMGGRGGRGGRGIAAARGAPRGMPLRGRGRGAFGAGTVFKLLCI